MISGGLNYPGLSGVISAGLNACDYASLVAGPPFVSPGPPSLVHATAVASAPVCVESVFLKALNVESSADV